VATAPTVLAAGVLAWREAPEGVLVLLVRRSYYEDVSIPKGKVDPGELLPETAVRELREETGVQARLGAPIGEVRYEVRSGPKYVKYWLAEVTEAQAEAAAAYAPNDEIASVEWVPIERAALQVTYPHDAEMIRDLARRLRDGSARTFGIAIARHGKALSATDWDGPDARRPLLHHGEEQARTIAPSLAAFGPVKIRTSPATRCLATMTPLAALAGLEAKPVPRISQDAFEAGRSKAAKEAAKRLRKREDVVLCSHGPVIAELVAAIRSETNARLAGLQRAASLSTGDFAVLHVTFEAAPRLVAVEVHSAG